VKRNFHILSPLDFLAEFMQHILPKGSHLFRYYGWHSNKSRGMRKKAEASDELSSEAVSSAVAATGSSQAWAIFIKRTYEVDPLCCPECDGADDKNSNRDSHFVLRFFHACELLFRSECSRESQQHPVSCSPRRGLIELRVRHWTSGVSAAPAQRPVGQGKKLGVIFLT